MTPRPSYFLFFLPFFLPVSIGQVWDASTKRPSFFGKHTPFCAGKNTFYNTEKQLNNSNLVNAEISGLMTIDFSL